MHFFSPEFELCEWLCNSPTWIPHTGISQTLTFVNGLEISQLGIPHLVTSVHIIACLSLCKAPFIVVQF